MPRLKLTLAYVGTAFMGWQSQPGGHTVQDALEAALSRVCDERIRCKGAGRTDAGVHALGQTAHADVPGSRLHVDWRLALNSQLPRTVNVLDARVVPDSFDAQFCALGKSYTYALWPERSFCLPQRLPFVWKCGPLDVARLREAAALLEGRHDFASFMNRGTPVACTVRRLSRIEVSECPPLLPGLPGEIVLRFTADGFLKQMVRNLTGCLVLAAKGRLSLADVRGILEARDRTCAPETAPPTGLTLERVDYGEDGLGRDRRKDRHAAEHAAEDTTEDADGGEDGARKC
ncbi:tRNA pseudouridine synthase A [Desulfovibrio sp. X2]|uniref:tRNA pseudouridine(38-40) synthase TruA n=1 Tax=Desulfovibrio sp. X2 TaxID=941449 RepID=UPI0003587881|nr:tRNA pseudouridine(38-40) synthase TruA [Desulfovibrio sp. X2]EPR43921.1 tRNA pseudouridine synthase A [Desulfovibrio sp. X2]